MLLCYCVKIVVVGVPMATAVAADGATTVMVGKWGDILTWVWKLLTETVIVAVPIDFEGGDLCELWPRGLIHSGGEGEQEQ